MNKNYKIWRDENGIPHIEATNEADMYQAQGYVHARDRGMQILLMRIIGQGKLSELLDSSDESLKVDSFFRRMNWFGNTYHQIEHLSVSARNNLEAYCAGINEGLALGGPLEFKLLGYKPTPWKLEDSILLSRMMGYLTLVQSQGDIERLLVELIQSGVDESKLEALFPGMLHGLDRTLINKVSLSEKIVPDNVLWKTGVPRMMASNNWVIAGKKTASGKPMLASDPHLEVNRLPNVWSEISMSCGTDWLMGSTIPGLPGVMIGRNKKLAWGATYAFIDTVDSWIERCEQGKYYRETSVEDVNANTQGGEQFDIHWHEFSQRKEVIYRKNKAPVELTFYENELGTLEGNPDKDGYYLNTRWAAADSGAASVEAIFNLLHAESVAQGKKILSRVETGWNYVFADSLDNIGYQMSGKVPLRKAGHSGLLPMPAWREAYHWQGFVKPEDMPECINPDSGFFATANENLNRYGKAAPINIAMGNYRAERIRELLQGNNAVTLEDIFNMHFDVFSKQAEAFMQILKPLLPNTSQGKILSDWDFCYQSDSQGAYFFELFYQELYREVFGAMGVGCDVIDFLHKESSTFIDFYANFDAVLLDPESPWYAEQSQVQIFTKVAEQALKVPPETWRSVQQYEMKNILFDGKLPKFLGFDKGPITAIGGRATIHQGQIYRCAGRETTFLPSYRMATDLIEESIYTNLAGGPSDRRFSKWYCSDLDNWLTGQYKCIHWQNKLQKPF